MARYFNDASTDKIAVANYAAINNLTTLTIACWIYRDAAGGGGLGRIVDKNQDAGAGAGGWHLYCNTSAGHHVFDYVRWDTLIGSWRWDAAPVDTLYHLAITYDAGSTSNDPIFYVDGSPVSVTEVQNPSGSLASETTLLTIGNRDDNLRNFGGGIAELGIWNRVLSAGEIEDLATGSPPQSPACVPSGLVLYMLTNEPDSPEPNFAPGQSAQTGTVTGTTVIGDPPAVDYCLPSTVLVGAGLTRSRLLERPRCI